MRFLQRNTPVQDGMRFLRRGRKLHGHRQSAVQFFGVPMMQTVTIDFGDTDCVTGSIAHG